MDILNGFMQSVLMEAKKDKISKKQEDIKEEKDDSEDITNDSNDKPTQSLYGTFQVICSHPT